MTTESRDNTLTVGTGRVDITPPLSVPYLGFERTGRHAFFEGVHDRLLAKALVMDDGRRRIALLTADSIGFSRRIMGDDRDFIAEVRCRIERLAGIAPEQVMIAATHAHSTPETLGVRNLLAHPGAAAWLETLADQLASAVAIAAGCLEPVRVKYATGTAEGISCSRRIVGKDGRMYSRARPAADEDVADRGVNDFQVAVLCFEGMDGRPEAVLVHFPCHPVTMQVNPLVSADFPGAATRLVEGAGGGCGHCQYLQGACGDINPIRGDTRDFRDVERYGHVLAGEVIKQLGLMNAPDYPVAAGRVDAACRSVQLPSRQLPDLTEIMERQRRLQDAYRHASTDAEREDAHRRLLALRELLERVKLGAGPFEAEVQVLRIGDVVLVGIPGEPFAQMGLDLKTATAVPLVLCVGYANGYLGYIAPPSAWDQGGYEVSLGMWSIVGPEAYGILIDIACDLVAQVF